SLLSPASASSGLARVAGISGLYGSVSQTVSVIFDRPMNPAAFNAATVTLYKISDTGLSEAAYAYYALQYEPQLKTLNIKPDPSHNTGFWDDNSRYRVALSPGLTTLSGASLDGNSNNIAEDAAFDTYHFSFGVGTPAGSAVYANILGGNGPLQSLRISSVTIDGFKGTNAGGTTVTVTSASLVNGISGIASSLPVTLTATFNMRLDVATAWAGPATIPAVITFTDSNGTPVAPTSVTLTTNNTAIRGFFASGLAANTRYLLSIKGGLSGLRSSNENSQPLMRYVYFSGKSRNYASASDDTPLITIDTTAGTYATAGTPPTVSTATILFDSANGRYVVPFTTVSGNGKMDASTLNTSNLKLMINSYSSTFSLQSTQGQVPPKDIVYDVVANTVYVYIPDDFIIPVDEGYSYAYFKIFISHNIRSADGLYLDGDGNGVASQDYKDDVFTGNSGNSGVQISNLLNNL
ncbi:MAG: hypothetical protein HGA76_04245, partial [Candidatus Firestonebacteria bacterium]|nr:hypothetical protein [Candidatus Firestonebacteria bacterium]